MIEPARNSESWMVIAAATALVVGGGLFLADPFESARPKIARVDEAAKLESEAVPARLWQDPFTVMAHREKLGTSNASDPHVIPPSAKIPELQYGLIVMPVMVRGEFYTESVEKRHRRRYAALSAMFALDYQPLHPGEIGSWQGSSGESPRAVRIPFEWLVPNEAHYRSSNDSDSGEDPSSDGSTPGEDPSSDGSTPGEDPSSDDATAGEDPSSDDATAGGDEGRPLPVLLLWMDERDLGNQPLREITELLPRILEDVAPAPNPKDVEVDPSNPEDGEVNQLDPENVKVNLLGPAGSGTLQLMVAEVIAELDNPTISLPSPHFSIYSPFATASAKHILGEHAAKVRDKLKYSDEAKCKDIGECDLIYGDNDFTSVHLMEQAFDQAGIDFFRTIPADKRLLESLVDEEFEIWGIDPLNSGESIILISEWDTFYGRSLPAAFVDHVSEIRKIDENGGADARNDGCNEPEAGSKNADGESGRDEKCQDGVFRYVYMRGLDGEVLMGPSPEEGTDQEEGVRKFERAIGESRFDYLRRLAQDIERDSSGDFRTVGAVGVLGSDVYDKLLILQALRPSFPQALFFTTDVDARYMHPAEMDWARGLVIASGYGPNLRQPLLREELCISSETSRELPPFRDSYQTSLFVAAQLAVARSTPPSDDDCHFDFREPKRLRPALANFAPAGMFEVGVLSVVPLGRDQAPGRRSAGVVLVAFAAIVLFGFVYNFIVPRRSLRDIAIVLLLTIVVPALVVGVVWAGDGTSGEPLPLFNGSNMLPTLYVLFLTAVTAILLYRHARRRLGSDARRLIREFDLVSIERWRDYFFAGLSFGRRHSALWKRLPRICVKYLAHWFILLALAHLAISFLAMFLLGDFPIPIRGEITLIAYYIGVTAALLGFFLFTYLVADEARSCQTFAHDLLSKQWCETEQSLDGFVKRQVMDVNLSTPSARDAVAKWRGVQVLADRTKTLEAMIYYPFVVLFLIVVAHNSLIDNWQLGPSVLVVLGSGVIVNVSCILLLRHYMQRLRTATIASLQHLLDKEAGRSAETAEMEAKIEKMCAKIEQMIGSVDNEQRGVFGPLGRDTILRAPLVPLGGFASLYLIELVS